MRILVCIKQVPDSTVRVKVGADGKSVATDGITWAISPYDEYAMELALERKDADPSTVVSVVTVGPSRSRDALRQALAMGADDATLVTGAAAEAAGGIALGSALATVVREIGPDVVLVGRQASDDEQGLVGAALAHALGWPLLTNVERWTGDEIWRATEGGHEVWKATGPAVLSVQRSEKEPRYPSLPGIMKAKKKEIPEKDLASLDGGAAPSPSVVAMEPPPARGGGKIFKEGDVKQHAAAIAKALRDEAKVL
ncbi:MAG TPA: electron transfer flavoprotein subunit beta/FixA family protein [Candidatus Limnocylindria bacterium]|nr:electron transfer flavoprotein subunit beta/FixA family protein [Candidatus Limnocylindria bacterium]